MKADKIIIRVYALICKGNQILLSDEFWYDTPMTKFPGGGLELGEGLLDCLKREIEEELHTEVVKATHFMTYDGLIMSDFIQSTQVIPVYYIVEIADESKLDLSMYRYDFHQLEEGAIRHRWIEIEKLDTDELTFCGDRVAFEQFKMFIKKEEN